MVYCWGFSGLLGCIGLGLRGCMPAGGLGGHET